ncbi:PAS domain S-box-containing protein/diguanylate cyclase (GGDEF)-like protein [Halanaerobium saccharolyticum]|uniref:PAS domain S-box-containing protein/diguanylate cyclase (GGDEF)-like protein n=1 Tax=Halanaerobium saccharolyticum TaxID=43595 RepID=A0A2T5RFL9_9FIRM|nr:GGDEF domain-containing protein [Halanaerobium saccharolyticum]OEG61854.1 MAG: hypothetical protein BHK79_00940 [Halanaerobium sp. MDAL1]PTV93123.1 PAS domain S-box-containing protein/diguanylate cyclase (GGDEF)-like protein [Halanaerobium saccharolyticum]
MRNLLFSINDLFNRKNLYLLVFFSGILLITGIYHFMVFHLITELFSVFVAFAIFMLAYYSRERINNNYLIILGIAFLYIGLFDLIHTLTYKGMGIFEYSRANLPTQIWLIARYLESLSILAAVGLVARRKAIKFKLVFKIYTFVSLIFVFSLLIGVFPDAFLEGSGLTNFKKLSEYFIAGVLLLSLVISFINRKKFDQNIYKLMLLTITITIISELSFTVYDSVYGIANIIGHILKFISFYLIFELMLKKIIVEPQEFIFRKLKLTTEKWNLAADAANLGLWELDLKNEQLNYDQNFIEMLGYKKDKLKINLKEFKKYLHPEDLKQTEEKLQNFIKSGENVINLEYRIKVKSGQYKWMSSTGQITKRSEEGEALKMIGIQQDINQKKQSQQQLEYLSFHDNLTDLYNRRYFENEMDRLNYSRKYPLSIIIGDLDNLKIVNDNLGHKMGDKYLKMVAQIFKKLLRSEDFAARIGGDEIAVILPETNAEEVENICSRIKEKCEQLKKEDADFRDLFQVSLGCHTLNNSEQDLNQAFQRADQKMYQNKRKNKSTVK